MDELKEIAKKIRKDIFNLAIEHKNGHIAPAFSVVEIVVTLYEKVLTKQDKFILSKGHGCLSLYAVLMKKGYSPRINGHPDIEIDQGIGCTTGSLGHGLPIGVGMAFAKKFKNEEGRVFVVIGDGECQEGTIWESLNLARRFKLDNLVVIVDHNKLQALSSVKEVMDEINLKKKFESFGSYAKEVDGHNINELIDCLSSEDTKKNMAKVIIAHTIKGKGISFMENEACWHSRIPEEALLERAYKELE